MGIAIDQLHDPYIIGSGSRHLTHPPAIHLVLTQEEQARTYRLYQGSGGQFNGISIYAPSGTNNFYIQKQEQPINKLETTLSKISSTFNLTKNELASVCHQTRKTLYNWLNGNVIPRKSTMSRIFDLNIIVQAWEQSGFSTDKISLHRPIIDEQSLYDLLKQDTLDKELILFAGSRLNLTTLTQKKIPDPFA